MAAAAAPRSQRFEAKVIFVTGAGRGLAKDVVARFLSEGAKGILAFDNHAENLAASAAEWGAGERVLTHVGDVCSRDSVQAALDAAVQAWGRVDVLCNIAGIALECHFLDIEPSDWKRVIDINLTGSFNVAQIVARSMKASGGGVIINMSSKNGCVWDYGAHGCSLSLGTRSLRATVIAVAPHTPPNTFLCSIAAEVKYAHYNASKAGVILLTKTMALDLADSNSAWGRFVAPICTHTASAHKCLTCTLPKQFASTPSLRGTASRRLRRR